MILDRVLEVKNSRFNGEVKVVKSLAWGTYIQVGGITQSGGVVEKIWREALKNIEGDFEDILILGLGGGSVAKILRNEFRGAKITGVEIDPVMVEMGQKYLGTKELDVEIVIDDAYSFLLKNKNKKFDLIVVDIYQGKTYPSFFESDEFLDLVRTVLARGSGTLVFNRLYTSDAGVRKSAVKFGERLEKKFSKVERVFPLANLVFICKP